MKLPLMAQVFQFGRPGVPDSWGPMNQYILVGVKRYLPPKTQIGSCRKLEYDATQSDIERAEASCLVDTLHGIAKEIRVGFSR